ncbi:MAG: HAMP domain-containing sensor histidine kinase [Pseudomonadota bacterium]
MFLARSLSGRLLALTVIIVMVTEVLVFLPSIARFRQDFLTERLQMAQIASLALLAADDEMVEEALEVELLANAEVSTIVLRRDSARQLILRAPMADVVADTYDLREATIPDLIGDAVMALLRTEPRVIRVIGEPQRGGGEVIEITLAEQAMCSAMIAYSQRVLILSLIISVVTGVLVFVICRRLIVRPIEGVVSDIVDFQMNPERPLRRNSASSSLREIARAEIALGDMRETVQGALKQKTRLAELGAAVAKISHDLRNMLASAQLMADRLEGSKDPLVARVGPKLIGSIDRAANLCVSTLKHGKAEESPPEPRLVALRKLAAEVGEAVFAEEGEVQFENHVGEDEDARADPEHLFRIIANLARNARQAIERSGEGDCVSVAAAITGETAVLTISDNGPGMPAKAMENIFQPFVGGASRDGTGLGLAIAAELAAANDGELRLERSTTEGTIFILTLPR